MEVRAIKPAGYLEETPLGFDGDALTEADRSGKVGVIIQLRSPYAGGSLSNASIKAQRISNERLMGDVLAPYKMLRTPETHPDFGAATIYLSKEDITQLSKSKDRRIQGVLANKPQYKLSLTTSTAAMNMPTYWGNGYNANGQTIAILDSGIEKQHAMMKNANGTSIVTSESCYQTTDTWNGVSYVSQCPNQDPVLNNGDSLPNTPDAGRVFSETWCLNHGGADTRDVFCSHGTHVAGIAAGRANPSMSPQLSGVAVGANIASVTVTSPGSGLWVFHADYLKAVTDLNSGLGAGYYPYVINMSFGSGLEAYPDTIVGNVPAHPSQPAPTGTNTFAVMVNNLKAKNIPFIAAMGNDGSRNQMNEPASVPGVIKVGSVANNPWAPGGANLIVASLSNKVRPEYWPGEFILFAPGGESRPTGIRSANPYDPSNTASFTIAGTSQASPHVAGYYAMLKSAYPALSIDDISTYIQTGFSFGWQIPALGGACGPQGGASCNQATDVRFVRLP